MAKYILFKSLPAFLNDTSHPIWIIETNNKYKDVLGEISYYPRWKQFCFSPKEQTIFSIECLQDIINFIKEKNSDIKK